MKMRNLVGLAVAVPGLVVALAAPGAAASTEVVAFAGRIEVTLTPDATVRQLDVCFLTFGGTCANGVESSGVAAGASVDPVTPGATAVDGLQVRAEYAEQCASGTDVHPVGTATWLGKVHRATAWSPTFEARVTRVGLVAVIEGDATGVALFTPLGVPACGQPTPVAVAGAVALAP